MNNWYVPKITPKDKFECRMCSLRGSPYIKEYKTFCLTFSREESTWRDGLAWRIEYYCALHAMEDATHTRHWASRLKNEFDKLAPRW